ncbi:OprO/OprP family phosphate-selective porin [Stutzerimonas tarimensis]|uniref:OprO/OprP family phosphate-selective porin n=1 Tax=Stutzerimonas tarimensis TaxID=1507735 RepID=A0ABV7TCZ3_9GAMM
MNRFALLFLPLAAGTAVAENLEFEVGGRIQADLSRFDGLYSNDGSAQNTAYFRRVYLETSTIHGDWELVFNYDFSLNQGTRRDGHIHEALVEYSGVEGLELRFGRFDPHFGLENAISSSWNTALERSQGYDMANWANSHDNGLGLQALAELGDSTQVVAGIYRKNANDDGDHANQFNLRAVFAPRHQAGDVLHAGVSFARRDLDRIGNADVRYRSPLGFYGVETASGFDAGSEGNEPLLGGSDDADRGTWSHDRAWNLEAAWASGPLSLQAEYLRRDTRARGVTRDLAGRSWYVQVAYTLTGEAREYELADFSRISPDNAGLGAWELYYRYGRMDVEDDNLEVDETRTPGDASARLHTLGVNWYASESVRLGLMYVHARLERVTNEAGDDTGDGVVLRAQYTF